MLVFSFVAVFPIFLSHTRAFYLSAGHHRSVRRISIIQLYGQTSLKQNHLLQIIYFNLFPIYNILINK